MTSYSHCLSLKHRLISILAIGLLPFQNCSLGPQDCAGYSQCGLEASTSASTSAASGSRFPASTSGSPTSGAAGWTAGAGFGSGGSSSGTGGAGYNFGGSTGTGFTPGTPPPLPPTTQPPTEQAFTMTKNLSSVSVPEGADFRLQIDVVGGTYPYKFQWYHNDVPIESSYYMNIFMDYATRYEKEGTYYVVATDGAGHRLQSAVAQVSIQDPVTPCAARPYYSATAADSNMVYFQSLFSTPRGAVLHPASQAELTPINLDAQAERTLGYMSLARFNGFPSAGYGQVVELACKTEIGGVHAPSYNPGIYDYEFGYRTYENGNSWTYQGAVRFECRGNKWIHLGSNCNWVHTPPPESYGGG